MHPALQEARRSFPAFYRISIPDDATWLDALVDGPRCVDAGIKAGRTTVADPPP